MSTFYTNKLRHNGTKQVMWWQGNKINYAFKNRNQVLGIISSEYDYYAQEYFTVQFDESVTNPFIVIVKSISGTQGQIPTINYKPIYYSTNKINWTQLTRFDSQIYFSKGATVYFKSTNDKYFYDYTGGNTHLEFNASKCALSGNIMSMIYGDDFIGKTTFDTTQTFRAFFNDNTHNAGSGYTSNISDCSNLILPATTLTENCYYSMFLGCVSLNKAPILPATTLARSCYGNMFTNCISLTITPELHATTLAESCYMYMFTNCTSLTQAPALPATTLANYCYWNMFYGCTSLTNAPALPATTLAEWCYSWMFQNCTSLTQAPELPATTLTESCYKNMFYGCTNLNYIKCLATDISATDCTSNWVYNVAPTGDFVKDPSMNDWSSGTSGIPSGWTVVDYAG